MLNRVALLLTIATGCGTTDPLLWNKCPGCAQDPSGSWDLIADGAEIEGDYDVVGPPDPYMCITVKGASECTTSQSDNASPRWNEVVASSLSTADLTVASLSVRLSDKDTGGLDTNDSICSTSIHITADDLEDGGIRFSCSRGTAAYRFRFRQ
jgi:hypothetical protein